MVYLPSPARMVAGFQIIPVGGILQHKMEVSLVCIH
jgi:hypothetical protein